MTSKEKKQIILKRIEQGDARSYNEIAADLELEIWTRNNKGDAYVEKQRLRRESKNEKFYEP